VKDELGLSETEFGLLVGTPILTGSLVRVLLGIWADQFGGRRVFALVMALAAIATFLTSLADSYVELLIAALGIFGAGNAGCPIALAERANGLGDGYGLKPWPARALARQGMVSRSGREDEGRCPLPMSPKGS
jgi:nitrate/nitrite transporter NarK